MKKDLTLPTLASLVALLAFSSVGATYAWYQYNANVIIDYNGTSIGSSTVFEVGLVSETPLVGYEDYGLVREEIDGKDVYWCSSEVTTNISKYYLNSNGYSTSTLRGVTSGKYKSGDDFRLKRNPTFNDNYIVGMDASTYKFAEKKEYAHFELAFKVNVITPDGVVNEEHSKVSLRVVNTDSEGDIKDAMRVHFSSESISTIFAPTKYQDGKDVVGGVLDLNDDGVYDTHETVSGYREYVYGEYETYCFVEEKVTDGSDPVSLGGDGNVFNAEHRNGAYPIDMEKSVFCTADYEGIDTMINNKKTLAVTNDSGIAYLQMDVYLEGWDHSFVDAEMDHKFLLGMEFECK